MDNHGFGKLSDLFFFSQKPELVEHSHLAQVISDTTSDFLFYRYLF